MGFLPHRVNARSICLILIDSAIILSTVHLAAYLRLPDDAWAELVGGQLFAKAILIGAVTQLCLYYSELYDLRIVADRRELLVRLVQALGVAGMLLGMLYFWAPQLIIGRGVFAIAAFSTILGVTGWRFVYEWGTRAIGPRERLLLIGTNASAVTLARELYERKELGLELVGFIDPDPRKVGQPMINPGIIGTLDDIPQIIDERRVDRVVVSLADARGQLPMDKLLELKLAGVSFDHLATVYEQYTGKIAVENLRPSWLIFSEGFRKSRIQTALKRTIDIVASLVGLIVGSPLFALGALLVRMGSPGPVLYRQERVGQGGRLFSIMKFRSMRVDAEASTGAVWAQENDPRTTRFGAFLRRSRLDEIPQMVNVLRGDMSFVGPRPERPEFVQKLTEEIPYYGQRHIIKPGITGWAQVRYPYGATVQDALEKLQYDLFYIKHMSVGLDVLVILKTVKTVLFRGGR